MKIGIAGLTHLGVCLSIAAHYWGSEVVAFDTKPERVGDIRASRFDPAEPGVVDFLSERDSRYVVTDDSRVLRDCDLVLIAVDTLLHDTGENDDAEVAELLRSVAAVVPSSTPIVIASQVRPGFTRAQQSVHPELYYFMETLIFGRGIERARFPERYIIGTAQPQTALPTNLSAYLDLAGCPVHVMSYESAELTKLSANFFLAANIAAANSLAELAESLGADWRDIEPALREDRRIGQHSYISPGPGIGGANLTRDLLGIQAMAEARGVNADLARGLLKHSDHMRDWTMRVLIRLRDVQQIKRLWILGVAYKPGTTSTRGSAGRALVEALEPAVDMLIHDPLAQLPTRPEGSRAAVALSVEQVLAECDVVVVTTPWPEYAPLLQRSLDGAEGPVVVDPYRLIDQVGSSDRPSRVFQLGVAGEY